MMCLKVRCRLLIAPLVGYLKRLHIKGIAT